MNAVFTKVSKYHVEAVCQSPVHVGGADGKKGEILIHPVTGKPFIQGTSLAGVFSDYIKSTGEDPEKWFGSSLNTKKSDGRSRITFSDALFEEKNVMIEARPHLRIDPETSSVSSGDTIGTSGRSGHKLDMTYVSEGSSLSFDIYQFMNADENSDKVIERCLSALNCSDIRIGGRTTTGCGILKIVLAELTEYDMRNESDREMWTDESKPSHDLTEDIASADHEKRFTRIAVEVSAEKLVVKGNYIDPSVLSKYGYSEDRAPDTMPASNAQKNFIAAGSSLKGVFRSHIQAVSDYLGTTELFMEKAFSDTEKSKVFFRDSVFNDDVKLHITTRNKIDKFTGGTIDKSLFREAEISGKFVINIDIDTRESEIWNSNDVKRAVAMLVISVRDLAVHNFSIGSGASVGRGYTDVKTMNIETADGKVYSVDFERSAMNEETEKYVNECLGLLKEEC